MNFEFADRMSLLNASEIREILKVTQKPEVISFAGGLPAPETFPIEQIKEANRIVLEKTGRKALQYSTTEGFDPLRKWIAARMNSTLGTNFEYENILITHGSQQGLDLMGKIFLNKDDVVLCESPTYLAAISAFKAYECRFIEVPTDKDGMIPEELERIIKTTPNVKLIYTIPTFQNPTGVTWTLERRKAIVNVADKYNKVVIEDNPYGELRFNGENLPSLQHFDETGNIVCFGTFSKIFCPGYRIAWVAAHKDIIEKLVIVKQSTDLQCNTSAQMDIAKYLELNDIDKHIEEIRKLYKKRCDLALKTMEEEFPDCVEFNKPDGGLFTWIKLPENIDARDLLEKCLEKNVAFVPGGSFFPNGGHENYFRINYSNMPEERIVEGMKIIGQVLKEYI
ncbi:PLP-dependent aminotransferase family protein [uncultured Clostridium sp.]|uniref:aminotransferase-like domain-containing protein n=1 Tax=uncultured Clostridium sp. TaxID=59620 RepID=UPI0025D6F335|nr:PLP-dependent aminotransferase family protein [uncultured Clostridium sp.]